ncbi:MAG: bacteriohemerythrin [Proteobacteria bacterium]|nr:bacteriohemerythrin [Pseudomonadota bacterium]
MNEKNRWDSRLKVGSEIIDNQHKVLFDLIKDLNNAIQVGASVRVVNILLGVLRDYALQHFQTEEDFFEKHAEYKDHCLEHYTLIKRLNEFILDFRNNRMLDDKTPASFLEDWLYDHIELYDLPYFSHESVNSGLLGEPVVIDEFDADVEKRRQHSRIPHNEVVDGEILAHCYNATRFASGKAKIVNMSPGGLMLSSVSDYQIMDLLIVSCSIGRNFKMEEKVMVKAVNDRLYSVQFISPSEETIDFFTKLYGSVHLNRAKID